MGELHPEEWAVDGNRTLEPVAGGLVQPEALLPLLLGLDADQTVTPQLDPGAQEGDLRQKGKLFGLPAQAYHQVHLVVSCFPLECNDHATWAGQA
jgi:hypothetical protein